MYGLSYTPTPRTCQLCPTPVSNHARYCPHCADQIRRAKPRDAYRIPQDLERALNLLLHQTLAEVQS